MAYSISCKSAKDRAIQILNSLKSGIDINYKDKKNLFLYRTIYISLVYLGEMHSSEEYITQLITKNEWDNLNRGFHLEYYGDIEYNPGEFMSNKDDVTKDFGNTFSKLHGNLLTASALSDNWRWT